MIENNKYGMGTSVERASASTELYKRGEAFGIPGEQVDGMDVLAVKEAGERAVKHAKGGKGPYVLEMMTYRYRGHSMSDPAKYRTRDEVNKMRTERDPIDRFREKILEAKVASEDDLKSIDKDVKGIVSEAAEFAQNSPEPETEELFTDVYVDA